MCLYHWNITQGQSYKLRSSRVFIWRAYSGNGFREWNPEYSPSPLLSRTLTTWDYAQVLFRGLAKNRKPGPYCPCLYTFNTSSSCSCLTVRTNPKSNVMPHSYVCATTHWEPSGLLAESQAHLPSPLTFWRTSVSYYHFLMLHLQHDLYWNLLPSFRHDALFQVNNSHFPAAPLVCLLIPASNSYLLSLLNVLSSGFPPQ